MLNDGSRDIYCDKTELCMWSGSTGAKVTCLNLEVATCGVANKDDF